MIVKEPKKLLKLTDKFKLGKYEGSTIEHVIDIDYEHIRWCFENVKGFALDRNARIVYQNVEESNREFNVRTTYSHYKVYKEDDEDGYFTSSFSSGMDKYDSDNSID